ncbi:MAG TPA: type IV secretion system protein, partial [Allosphingosinicella sp.]|nr:type IV secretion system protein [Allosphingosinicella sp.]
ALATGWPAYRTLFYDVAFEAPGELAAEIGRPAGLIDGGSLAARLQIADRQMVDLAIAGTGEASLTPQARLAERVEPHPFGGFEAFALGSGRALYLTGAVAGFGSVRLIAGLLLALGPLFIGFLLFEGTRSLFEGWLRVLGGVAIGALGTSMAMAVELALLEPKLADWLARRAAGLPIPGAAVELLAITLIFTLMLAAVLFASVRVARGFRLATVWQIAPALRSTFTRDETFTARAETRERRAANDETRRAAVVADAVAATQRREAGQAAMAVAGAARSRARSDHMADQGLPPRQAVPLGQSFRRTQTRSSASAGRRDRRP